MRSINRFFGIWTVVTVATSSDLFVGVAATAAAVAVAVVDVARERVEADDGQRDARVAPVQATAGLWHHRLPGGGGRDARGDGLVPSSV